MDKRRILDIYMGLKDDGLTHQEIEAAFLDPENTGGDPIDINLELQQLKSLNPEQIQEMTSDAFAKPEDSEFDKTLGEATWDVSQQALQGMTFGYADEIEARQQQLLDTYQVEIDDKYDKLNMINKNRSIRYELYQTDIENKELIATKGIEKANYN